MDQEIRKAKRRMAGTVQATGVYFTQFCEALVSGDRRATALAMVRLGPAISTLGQEMLTFLDMTDLLDEPPDPDPWPGPKAVR